MLILGIETSCDETAAAVVDGDRTILSDIVLSQLDEHRPYGGIVPEIAARSHLEHLDRIVAAAMAEAGIDWGDLDGVAATGGPGLIGGLLVGMTAAKAIALVHGLPLMAVNHLEGHALSARLTAGIDFPYLLLLVSGGHCELLGVAGPADYRPYGRTVDDAVGEAFDKAAKAMGLPYPGGPAIETAAASGDPARFRLPRPMVGREDCNFSFSGLKTALARLVERQLGGANLSAQDRADAAAGFQAAVADVLADRTARALAQFRRDFLPSSSLSGGHTLVVAGGVAANALIRQRLGALAAESGLAFAAPPPRLCTDNAAMIAWAGIERLRLGLVDDLDFAPRPRWPLRELAPAARP